jgi:hypothetical protein
MKLRISVRNILITIVTITGVIGCTPIERKLLFYPSHHSQSNGLSPWTKEGQVIGFSRKTVSPNNIWLMLHGNGGQASDRIYALPCFSENNSVYIVEYPGYGNREGVPSRKSFDKAAQEAYIFLRETYPNIPVCVVAESIGSGPALSLTSLDKKPDKFVLIVPFDELSSVAKNHFPSFLVWLILRDKWNNIDALSEYNGPVDIYGAEADTVIPIKHARALAASYPGSRLVITGGGHNDWSHDRKVRISYP